MLLRALVCSPWALGSLRNPDFWGVGNVVLGDGGTGTACLLHFFQMKRVQVTLCPCHPYRDDNHGPVVFRALQCKLVCYVSYLSVKSSLWFTNSLISNFVLLIRRISSLCWTHEIKLSDMCNSFIQLINLRRWDLQLLWRRCKTFCLFLNSKHGCCEIDTDLILGTENHKFSGLAHSGLFYFLLYKWIFVILGTTCIFITGIVILIV